MPATNAQRPQPGPSRSFERIYTAASAWIAVVEERHGAVFVANQQHDLVQPSMIASACNHLAVCPPGPFCDPDDIFACDQAEAIGKFP